MKFEKTVLIVQDPNTIHINPIYLEVDKLIMDNSISSAAFDPKDGHRSSESESEFSYDEDHDTDHEDELEDQTIESQRLIAIGVLQDDESKASGITNIRNIQAQEPHLQQQQAAYDEAVANNIAREEYRTKMRIKEERQALGQRRPKPKHTSMMSRSSHERREKMRTLEARKGTPRSRPLRATKTEVNNNAVESSKRSLKSADDETIASAASSAQRSVSSGIDLDEKTRQRILARSAQRYARPRRTSLGNTNNGDQIASVSPRNSRPSDEKRNLRIFSSRMTESSTNNSASQQRRTSTHTSWPSDEKAAFRRQNNHPRRARAVSNSRPMDTDTSIFEECIAPNDSNDLELGVTTDDSMDLDMENNPGNDVNLEAAELSDDEEPEVLPGAFAVSGIGEDEDEQGISGYDSGFENDSLFETEDAVDMGEESQRGNDLESTGPGTIIETGTVITSALTAELYEVEETVTAVDAKVLDTDGETKERIRKLKIQISCAFLAILLVAVTIMALVFTGTFRKGAEDVSDEEGPPVITGWEQVGEFFTLEDPYKDDIRFGNGVAISADGNRIAVGLPGLDDSEDGKLKRAGSVHIFDMVNGTNWEENTRILGAYSDAKVGTNVALSDDEKRIAIGAPSDTNMEESGYVAIYEESNANGQWNIAANFSVEIDQGSFGELFAFSGDGSVIAIGDIYFNNRGIQDTGAVRIYQEINGNWNQMGTAIPGSKKSDRFGWSVSLSKDGSRVAASSLGFIEPGHVRVFDFNGTDWEMIGSSLIGESDRDFYGFAVELSRDGAVLAVSAIDAKNEQEENVGIVRTHRYTNGDWMGYGQPLEGEQRQDAFGSSMSLSSDGSTIAIGGPENGNFCNSCGQVKIFQMTTSNDELVWESLGSTLGKLDIDNGQFGYAVALSETGKRVVSGAPFTKFDGFYSKVGQVLVFDSIDEADNSN